MRSSYQTINNYTMVKPIIYTDEVNSIYININDVHHNNVIVGRTPV